MPDPFRTLREERRRRDEINRRTMYLYAACIEAERFGVGVLIRVEDGEWTATPDETVPAGAIGYHREK